MPSLTGKALAASSHADRPASDFYPTPPEVTRALLDFIMPTNKGIWECACGQGHISKVLEEDGYQVTSTDLFDTGYGKPGVDFLTSEMPAGCNFIITNPPFNLAEQFIRRAASLPLIGFALLLKSQYWHAAKRASLFEEHRPAYVLPLTWRPDFLFGGRGGAPTMDCIWTVWLLGSGRCEYIPLRKPTHA